MVVVGVALLVIYPWSRQVLTKRKRIPQEQEQLAKLVDKLKVLNQVDEEQISQYLLDVEMVLPSQPRPPLVLASLETLAGKAGLKVSSSQYTGIEKGAVVAEMTSEGGYEQVIEFVRSLQNAAPVLQVRSLKISQVRAGGGAGEQSSPEKQELMIVHAQAAFEEIVKDLGEIETPVKVLSPSEKQVLQKAQTLEKVLQPFDESTLEQMEKGRENPFK